MFHDFLRRDRDRRAGRGTSPVSALPMLLALLLALPLAAQDGAKAPLHTPASAPQDDGFGPPPPPSTNGPKMVIVQTEFDWGQVLHGEVVEHSYPVRNEGDDVLRITSVKPG
jgi:hypothetical protein